MTPSQPESKSARARAQVKELEEEGEWSRNELRAMGIVSLIWLFLLSLAVIALLMRKPRAPTKAESGQPGANAPLFAPMPGFPQHLVALPGGSFPASFAGHPASPGTGMPPYVSEYGPPMTYPPPPIDPSEWPRMPPYMPQCPPPMNYPGAPMDPNREYAMPHFAPPMNYPGAPMGPTSGQPSAYLGMPSYMPQYAPPMNYPGAPTDPTSGLPSAHPPAMPAAGASGPVMPQIQGKDADDGTAPAVPAVPVATQDLPTSMPGLPDKLAEHT
eukprot:1696438-Rhodomonas_salina.2